MLRLVCALSVLLPALLGGAARQDAPAAPGGEEFITAEVSVGKVLRERHALRVPVVRPGERKSFDDDKWAGGKWEFMEYCPPDIGCGYFIHAVADQVADDRATVVLTLKYNDRKRCDDQKEAAVIRGQTTELKMKCGARVKAFYAPRPKGAN